MRISELQRILSDLQNRFGDLPIAGGSLSDDSGLEGACAINGAGEETTDYGDAVAIFLQA